MAFFSAPLMTPSLGYLATLGGLWQKHPRYKQCVGHWLITERGGSTVFDMSGNSHQGTLTNMDPATDWVLGPHGAVLDLDGSDDHVSLGTASDLNLQGVMSCSCWMRTADFVTAAALIATSVNGNNSNYAMTFGFTDNKFEFWNDASGPVITSVQSISDSGWHFYVATRNGSASNLTISLYIDGKFDTSAAVTRNPDGSTADLVTLSRFGGFNGYYITGNIGDVRLYNRVLTATEVSSLYTVPFLEFVWAASVLHTKEISRFVSPWHMPWNISGIT